MTTIAQVVDAARGFAGIADMTNPSREPVWLADFTLLRKADDTTITLGACTATPAWNGSGATAGVQYTPRLISPSITQTILSGGLPGFSSAATWGTLQLVNTDGYWNGQVAGQTIDYLDPTLYEWQSVVIRLGVNPDAYGDMNIIDGYRLEGRPQVNHPFVELSPAGALLDDKRPALDERYLGLGMALDSDDGTLHVEAGNSDVNIAAADDFIISVWFNLPANAANMALFGTRNNTTGTVSGITLYVAAAGTLALSVGDGAAEFVISDTTAVDDGERHKVEVWADKDAGTMHGEIDGVAFSTDGADISAMVAVSPERQFRTHEKPNTNAPLTGWETDLYVATGVGIAPSADERKARREGPASLRSTGALYHWPMEEGSGVEVENGFDPRLGEAIERPTVRALTGTGAASEEIDCGNNGDMSGSTDYTVWKWFRVSAAHAGTIISKRTNQATANAGWIFDMVSGGAYRFVLSDGVDEVTMSGGTQFTDGVWRCIIGVVDVSGSRGTAETGFLLLTDSAGQTITELDTQDITAIAAMGNAIDLRHRARGDGSNDFQGDDSSAGFVEGKALTDAELRRVINIHPSQADLPELEHYWEYSKADEAAGSLTDTVGAADGTIGGSASWVNRNGTVTPGTSHNGGGNDSVWISTLTGSFTTINGLHGGAGRYKPQGYGFIREADVVWLDNFGHDYTSVNAGLTDAIVGQFNAGDFACEPISSTVNVVVTEGEVVATEFSGVVGDYVVDLTNGWIYWDVAGGFPADDIRVTFKGMKFNSSAYSDRLGLISREWLGTNGHLTSGELPEASANNFDAEFPYPVGVFIPGGKDRPASVRDVLRESFAAPGLFTSTNLAGSRFLFAQSLVNPDDFNADITLTDPMLAGIPRQLESKPVRSVSIGYAKNHGTGEWAYTVPATTEVDDDDGRDLIIKTALINQADAQVWAEHVLARLKDPLVMEVPVARHFWEVYLARTGRSRSDVVSLQSDFAPAVSSALKFLVVGVVYTPPRVSSSWEVELQLLRPST